MSADLDQKADGSASMMYNLETGLPWHRSGTAVQGLATTSEAIKAAGIDWTVEKRPVFSQHPDGSFAQVPGKYATTRTSDDKVLGIVGKDYNVVQNLEGFEFIDSLLDSGEAKFDTAGALAGGCRVWMSATLGDEIMVAGTDPHRLFGVFLNSHDGSKAVSMIVTPVRVVCANTEAMAIRGAKQSWSMTHRTTLAGKVTEAREALQLSFKYMEAFEAEVQKMLDIQVTTDQFREIVKDIYPAQKRMLEKRVTLLTSLWENSPTIHDAGIGGTAWGAFNAITEAHSHHQDERSPEAKLTKSLWGFDQQVRNKAHERLLALA